jgi:hypothetical protein
MDRPALAMAAVFVDERGTVIGACDRAAQTTEPCATSSWLFPRRSSPSLAWRARPLLSGTPPESTLVGVGALAVPDWLVERQAL